MNHVPGRGHGSPWTSARLVSGRGHEPPWHLRVRARAGVWTRASLVPPRSCACRGVDTGLLGTSACVRVPGRGHGPPWDLLVRARVEGVDTGLLGTSACARVPGRGHGSLALPSRRSVRPTCPAARSEVENRTDSSPFSDTTRKIF